MLPNRLKTAILATCAIILVASVAAWAVTGARMHTRYGPRMVVADGPTGRLIIPGGASSDEVAQSPQIGLLPAGPGLSAISVVVIAGPAVLAAAGAMMLPSRSKTRPGSAQATGTQA